MFDSTKKNVTTLCYLPSLSAYASPFPTWSAIRSASRRFRNVDTLAEPVLCAENPHGARLRAPTSGGAPHDFVSVSLHASVQTTDQLPFLVGMLFKGQQFQRQSQ